MFSKLSRYIAIAAALLFVASCADDVDAPQNLVPDSPGTVTIRFNNSTVSRSEASDNSETLIANAFVALYPAGTEETVPAVAVGNIAEIGENVDATVTIRLTELMVNTLFNNGTDGASCRIYALVNYPDGTVFSEKPTIAELKNVPVVSTFDSEQVQPSFIMTGESIVTYTAGTGAADPGKASGKVDLYRAAAKIRLNVSLPASITINGGTENEEIWTPEATGIQVMLNNGVKSAVACPVPAEGQVAWAPAADAYYDSKFTTLKLNSGVSETGYPYTMEVPFYTYPNVWEEKPEETHKTTLTLVVPWRQGEEDRWHNYYYQVPVTPATLPHIDRNYSYNINLRVGMLGSLVPETPLELTDLTYQVVNWSNQAVNVDIKDFRYLVVNPNAVSVQNEGEVLIPFYSSHDVDVQNVTMTFQRFNFYSNGNGDVVNIEVPKSTLDASETTEDGTTYKMVDYAIVTDPATNQKSLKIKHPLEIWDAYNGTTPVTFTGKANNVTPESVANSITNFRRPTNPESPYSSYIFKVHIQHGDNPAYAEDITITQYPAMYIEADRNPGGGNNNKGNVWVNASNGTGGNYGGVHGLTGDGNRNPNMYVINISQLNLGSEYIIGDPRTGYANNDLSGNGNLATPTSDGAAADWCESAEALYNTETGERRLLYYYPTNEVAATDRAAYMVAPKIRVASSYGVTNSISRENARRRAATYQERACPAGRWRLPTLGEFTYITQLSAAGKIPTLFTPNNNYLTAQGVYRVDNNGKVTPQTNLRNTAIRAVYDEWYWENSQYQLTAEADGNYTYTLGDVPRGKQ